MRNEKWTIINNNIITSGKKCSKKFLSNSYEVAISVINKAQSTFLKDETNFTITTEDSAIIHSYLFFLQKTFKPKDIYILMKSRKISENKIKNFSNSIAKLLPKFLLVSLIASRNLSKFLKYENLKLEIYKLIKLYFINGFLDKEFLLYLVKLVITINKKDLNEIIDFLLSFNSCSLSGEIIINLEYIINNLINFFENITKNDYESFLTLSNNKCLYKLLELNQILKKNMKNIFSFLVKIYKFNFDINLPLLDLNNLFILKKNENIITKIENLQNRNDFFTELLDSERESIVSNGKIIINSGFYFNGQKGSGINITINKIIDNSFTLAISFLILENKNKVKYTIFSFSKKNDFINLYIENNILKLYTNEHNYELFSNIKTNKNYICFIKHHEDNGNKINYFYLNGVKSGIINNKIKFPIKDYELNIGFKKYKNEFKDNFMGIIGCFILFNIALDENSMKNLIELKNDFNKIIYINSNIEFSTISDETKIILEKFKNNDIINHINIYMNSNITNKNLNIKIQNLEKVQFLNSFESFINNNGIKYLETQLYWFIGIIDKVKNVKEININLKIRDICNIFFICLGRMTTKQVIKYQKDIKCFFYTLNNLMDISISYGYKIDISFLSLFLKNIASILLKEKWFSFCFFLLSLDNYDNESKNKSLEVLFSALSTYITEYKKQLFTKEFFEKILQFDIIYSSNDYGKNTKKKYSELIRKSLELILNDGEFGFLNSYILKFKEFRLDFEIIDPLDKDFSKTEECIMYMPTKSLGNYEKIKKSLDKDNNMKPNLLLIYKYLKNLYWALGKNKNKTFTNFIIFCNNGVFADYLKEILEYLINNYEIKFENYDQLATMNTSLVMNDLKLSELLKSLCISFLLEIDETITNKNKVPKSLSYPSTKNTSDTAQQRNYSVISVETSDTNIPLDISNNFYLNFFNSLDISPYTFRSIFLHNFSTMSNKKKIKYIKNITDTNPKIFSKGAYLPDSKELTINLIELIEQVGSNGSNTFFMTNYLFLEYMYEIFNNTIINLFENLINSNNLLAKTNNSNIVLPLTNSLNYSDDLILKFYTVILNCIERQITKNDDDENLTNEKSQNIKAKKRLEDFKNIILEKISQLINLTVFTFKDPFYFKLLFEIYIADENNNYYFHDSNFVLKIIKYIIEKINNYNTSKNINLAFEINNKNLLILIYKMIFFVNKRKFLLSNEIFRADIIIYLSTFWTKSDIFFYKILFPLEDINDTSNKKVYKKLLVELLLEIFVDLYLANNKKDISSSELLSATITDLLSLSKNKNVTSRLNEVLSVLNENLIELKVTINTENKQTKNTHSFFYLMDKIFIKQNMINDLVNNNSNDYKINNYNLVRDYINSETKGQNGFSVTLLFLIKIMIYIQIFEKNPDEKGLLKFFEKIATKLCKDAKELFEKNKEYNPLKAHNKEINNLYKEFQDYIRKEYTTKSSLNKQYLLSIIQNYQEEITKYKSIEYVIKYKECNDRKENRKNTIKLFNFKFSFKRKRGKSDYSKKNLSSKKKEEDYVITPKFKKDYIRGIFSTYLLDLLTYDRDFINLKNIYYYEFSDELGKNENIYNLSYPSKLKNKITTNYLKIFLKKDFDFFSSDYLKFTHKYINNNEKFKNSLSTILFPTKKILTDYDYLYQISNTTEHIEKNCEMITINGTIYGNFIFYNNCILFKSNKNDKRLSKNDDLTYICCSSKFDFLKTDKKIILEFNGILEIFQRRYLYLPIALEIFMKNGRSFLFNFFNEEENNFVLDFLSKKGIKIIKNPKQYFNNEEFSQKWKNNQITTFDYLLLLNKFSSRSYNELDQYPIMPWIFLKDEKERNFDLPMSIQNEESLDLYRNESIDSEIETYKSHSSHYSTSSYVCYYLMRVNPFTYDMIKLQSNSFDSPERQFIDIGNTLFLCADAKNNRELIPEIYSIPELYMNLNYNDFGKLTISKLSSGRINNINVIPYADNIFGFVYKIKKNINYNEKINNQINKWFNFIFGCNQYNKENKGNGFRNFSLESYSQNINIKKIIEDLMKKKKNVKEIKKNLSNTIGMILNFGQCPRQLFSSEHPVKECESSKNNNINNNNDNKNSRKNSNITSEKILQIIDKIENNTNYIWLNKNNSNKTNNLYFLINNKEIVIYQKDIKTNLYIFKNKIQIDDDYIFSNFNNREKKFIFCELKSDFFVFCKYLDDTIIINYNTEKYIYLLSSPISCIRKIKDNEFMTGHEDGMIFHWKIENLENKITMKLLKKLKSNTKMITSIKYWQKICAIAVSDENNIIIRNEYDFEFLNLIKISEEKIIIDVKISDYNFIYLLTYDKKREINELIGYSINGIIFGKIENQISYFNITGKGNIVLCLKNESRIHVLNPVNFKELFYKNIYESNVSLSGSMVVNIRKEKLNVIIVCEIKIRDKTIIKIIKLSEEESKCFL